MAVVSLSIIKNWFKTGLKPTQAQFWDTWDSFRHKQEAVPMTDVQGLDTALQYKADKSALDTHTTNDAAHPNIQIMAKIYPPNTLQIFKRSGNENVKQLEVNDFVKGIVEGVFIEGIYTGGDSQLLTSYNIINQIEF